MSSAEKSSSSTIIAMGFGLISAMSLLYLYQRRKRTQVFGNIKYTRDRNFSGCFTPNGSQLGSPVRSSKSAAADDKFQTPNNLTWLSPTSSEHSVNRHHEIEKPLVIVMMGFPGRGKTYISRKIARYLRWIEYRTRVFSIAKYRLDKLGNRTADFFDPSNGENYRYRIELMISVLEDACRYLDRGGNVAIIDGTHTTRDRRNLIREEIQTKRGLDILWIESICEDEAIIERHSDELCESPDYIDRIDFQRRIQYYMQSYEKLEDSEGSYIKIYDCGRKLDLHLIHGYLCTKIVSFVMNLHTVPRQVYLVRCGESLFNEQNLIGGNSSLSNRGIKFARALSKYFSRIFSPEGSNRFSGTDKDKEIVKSDNNILVWTSPMCRASETCQILKEGEIYAGQVKIHEWRTLRDLEVGVCDGYSYDQVKERFPEEYQSRVANKLRYRYPRGESYLDILNRLEPVIFEIERTTVPLVIVAHQAVLRCLYAYFLDFPHEELPYLSMPLHTLLRLEPRAYGVKEKRLKFVLDDESESQEPSSPPAPIKLRHNNYAGIDR